MMVIALQCLPGCSLPRSVHCIRLKLTRKLSTPGHQVSWKHALWKLPQRLQIVKHLLHGPSSWDKYLWEMSVLCFRTHAKHQPLEVSKKLPPLAYYWISVHYEGWLLPLKQMGGDALKDRILDEIVASPRSLMIARKTSHPLKTAFPCQYLTVDCWRGRGPAQLPAASSWVCFLWVGKALIQLCFTNLVRILHTSHEDIQGVGIFSSRLMLELYPAYSISCLLPWQDSMFLGHVSLMCWSSSCVGVRRWVCCAPENRREGTKAYSVLLRHEISWKVWYLQRQKDSITAGKLRHKNEIQPKQARAATLLF